MNDQFSPETTEIFTIINHAFRENGIDFYLIGARARDYWFNSQNIPLKRATNDFDFAMLIPNLKHFTELKLLLKEKYNFKLLSIPHRIIYEPFGVIVDLIPFGGIEEAGYVRFKDKFDTEFSVLGYQEVYDNTIKGIIDDTTFNIASLPGITILKLLAWADRPEERGKDIEDINTIIQYYFDIESESIYTHHLDLFGTDFDQTKAGARVLGRQIKSIIYKNPILYSKIIKILLDNTGEPEKSRIGEFLVRGTGKIIEEEIIPFIELLKGVQE